METFFIIVTLFIAVASSVSSLEGRTRLSYTRRSLPNAPDGYTPKASSCPSTKPAVRSAGTGLSKSESAWLEARRNQTLPVMSDFLSSLNISGFDVAGYFKNHSQRSIWSLPNIGIAVSGGGLRATFNGAGGLQAFDSREEDSGGFGGLLQSATYLSALSGGGWLVGSIFVNNFTTISDLQEGNGNDLWDFENTLFEGPDISATGEASYFENLHSDVSGKEQAGFEVSITDYYGLGLGYQFINASDGGTSYTWSSIRDQPGFDTATMPFPLLVADARLDGQIALDSRNTTVFEMGPFELGTWDPTNYGFVDMEFLGSNFTNGTIPSDQDCVYGFDYAGFILGTTSAVFNSLVAETLSSQLPAAVLPLVADIINETKVDNGFVSKFSPNPFKSWNPTGMALDSQYDALQLVDGGTDLQNLPLQPLIQPVRAVDVVIALDASNDVNGWPNGTALIATYERSLNKSGIANNTAFPSIPDQNTIVNLGLNTRPTFFGCEAANSSGPTPLLVYIPNAPYTALANASTFQLSYNNSQRDAAIENGRLVATMGNGSANAHWRTCLGCAVLSRSLARTSTPVPSVCNDCFAEFCWNGTLDASTPPPYAPELMGASPTFNGSTGSSSFGGGSSGSGSGGGSGEGGKSDAAIITRPVCAALALGFIAGMFLLH